MFGPGRRRIPADYAGTPEKYLPEDWRECELPGDIYRFLLKEGEIPDPHIGDNGKQCYWITGKDWWIKGKFTGKKLPDNIDTVSFSYLDGTALVYLNRECIGKAVNSFHPHRFGIQDKLNSGKNELLICFVSIDTLLGGERIDELWGWGKRRVFLRKPQFSFGWDWSLPIPSIGAGAVAAEADTGRRIETLTFRPDLSGRVDFFFETARGMKNREYGISVEIISPSGEMYRETVNPSGYCSHLSMNVESPELWFPLGYGKQPIYRYSAELIDEGESVDSRSGIFMFRDISVMEQPFSGTDDEGLSFNITVNGVKIFCKGSNWVPLSLQPLLTPEEDYAFYIEKAAECGFNMLRVWGGGVYETLYFYEECARLGIMVWQDFMFASAGYPADSLKDTIIKEAEYQLRRLHGLVTLWCGCNEDFRSWAHPFDQQSAAAGQSDQITASGREEQVHRQTQDPLLFSIILRGLTAKEAPGIPYIQSSPQSHEDSGNDPKSGNSHLSCWKYVLFETPGKPENFREHFNRICSFDSEFCVQGPCSRRSFAYFMPAEHLWPPDDMWIYHIQRGHRDLPHFEQTMMIGEGLFGPIKSLEDYITHGQAAHAVMTQSEYEYARYDWPNCGGTMSWMLNDCWPTANWSIIDFYRSPKPAYFAAKRACAPVLPMIILRNGIITFAVSNLTVHPLSAVIELGKMNLSGRFRENMECTMETEPNTTAEVYRKELDKFELESDEFLLLKIKPKGSSKNRKILPAAWFEKWKDVPWPDPGLSVKLIYARQAPLGLQIIINIETIRYARYVHLQYRKDRYDGSTWFSDNYFDLLPGTGRNITVTIPDESDSIDDFSIGWWGAPLH